MKRQFSILLHLLILLALNACGITTTSPSPMPSPTATTQPSRLPDPDEVKALLVQLVDVEKRAPGIVVGMIADDPQERWVVGYGRLSATDERVPDGDTVFEIASITKVFTGILLAQAVINGEVKLDDPISMYLPEGVTAPAYEGRSITLLDLATHTAGLPRWPANYSPKDPSNPFADYTMDQMYNYLSGYRLTRAPGSTYEYSCYGFGLLGNLLVGRAGQADYEALLVERIIMGHYSAPMGHHLVWMGQERTPTDTKMAPIGVMVKHYTSRGTCARFSEARWQKNRVKVARTDREPLCDFRGLWYSSLNKLSAQQG